MYTIPHSPPHNLCTLTRPAPSTLTTPSLSLAGSGRSAAFALRLAVACRLLLPLGSWNLLWRSLVPSYLPRTQALRFFSLHPFPIAVYLLQFSTRLVVATRETSLSSGDHYKEAEKKRERQHLCQARVFINFFHHKMKPSRRSSSPLPFLSYISYSV